MKFKIEITETLQKVVEVEAENLTEAVGTVEDMWYGSEIILTADDFIKVDFSEYKEGK